MTCINDRRPKNCVAEVGDFRKNVTNDKQVHQLLQLTVLCYQLLIQLVKKHKRLLLSTSTFTRL